MPELLKTSTMTSPRLTTTGFFDAFLVGVGDGLVEGVGDAEGVESEETMRACCSGWGAVAMNAAPAMATPTMATSITREGATTPRSSRCANRRVMLRRRIRAGAPGADADGRRAADAAGGPAAGRRPARRDG